MYPLAQARPCSWGLMACTPELNARVSALNHAISELCTAGSDCHIGVLCVLILREFHTTLFFWSRDSKLHPRGVGGRRFGGLWRTDGSHKMSRTVGARPELQSLPKAQPASAMASAYFRVGGGAGPAPGSGAASGSFSSVSQHDFLGLLANHFAIGVLFQMLLSPTEEVGGLGGAR